MSTLSVEDYASPFRTETMDPRFREDDDFWDVSLKTVVLGHAGIHCLPAQRRRIFFNS
jgi:hypothetical protein